MRAHDRDRGCGRLGLTSRGKVQLVGAVPGDAVVRLQFALRSHDDFRPVPVQDPHRDFLKLINEFVIVPMVVSFTIAMIVAVFLMTAYAGRRMPAMVLKDCSSGSTNCCEYFSTGIRMCRR